MNDAEKIARLFKKLRTENVKAYYVGEWSHNSDNVSRATGQIIKDVKPDLVFIEASKTLQPVIEANPAYLLGTNFAWAADATLTAHGKIFAIDPMTEEEKTKDKQVYADAVQWKKKVTALGEQYTGLMDAGKTEEANIVEGKMLQAQDYYMQSMAENIERQNARGSDKTNKAMASNIVDKIEEFYHQNKRMPVFVVDLGQNHLMHKHDVNEMINEELKSRHLPAVPAKMIDLRPDNVKLAEPQIATETTKGSDFTIAVNNDTGVSMLELKQHIQNVLQMNEQKSR